MNNTANINPAAVNDAPVALKDKKQNPQMKTFIKILKIFIAVTVVFAVIVTAVTCLILNFAANTRAREACEFLENNILYDRDYGGDNEKIEYVSFNSGYVSRELHFIDEENPENSYVTGDITDYNKMYKIVTYWFSKKVGIYFSSDGKDWELYIKRNLIKSSSGEYFLDYDYGYDIEHIISERNNILCDHDYVEEVIKHATCEEDGEIQRTCSKCGRIETEITTLEHDYEDAVCTLCGKKQRVNINADEWYLYKKVDGLILMNCMPSSINEYAGGIMLRPLPVCAHCHTFIDVAPYFIHFSYSEIWSRTYFCPDCENYTKAYMKFDFSY